MAQSSPASPAFFARDTGLTVVCVEGADATDFLNAQAMTRLGGEAGNAAAPAALADAKGRVLAVFHAWRTRAGWSLAIAASQAAWLQEHLERFVFRSKVRIGPPGDTELLGIAGARAGAALQAVKLPAPGPGQTIARNGIALVGLADNRWLAAAGRETLRRLAESLEPEIRAGRGAAWTRARLAAGEVEIRRPTRAHFLPQMLGLAELGAVSFQKGCYPGQEIIARTQNLGEVKRKLALLRLAGGPRAGAKLTLSGERLTVLDSVALSTDASLAQTVAPSPLPAALTPYRWQNPA